MWWTKRYINRRDWMLENLGVLKLTSDQAVILLMIDFMNEHQLSIIPSELAQRTGLDDVRVDEIIHNLVRSNILMLTPSKGGIDFNIDNLFQESLRYEYVDQNIFEVFESQLARPLSQPELVRLNGWLKIYAHDEVMTALRSAIGAKKVTMPYINSILINNRKEKDAQ